MTHNLGNFESVRIEVELGADIDVEDDPMEAISLLSEAVTAQVKAEFKEVLKKTKKKE